MKKLTLFNSIAHVTFPIAFDNGKGWKLDADGHVVLKDGNPVYVNESGGEMVVESGTISRLNGEAKGHRERAEAAEGKLKAFEGIDAGKAREAFELLSKVDQKKLIDAGEVDKVRDAVSKEFTAQISERDNKLSSLQQRIDTMTVQTAFKSSEFIRERVAVPAEMFEATFGKNFKVENEKLVPIGKDGNPVYSKKRVGEIADFDEALEIIVENYPHKDAILKANNAGGSGNNGNGGNRGGGRTMRRDDFEKLNPIQQADAAAMMGKGELTIAD